MHVRSTATFVYATALLAATTVPIDARAQDAAAAGPVLRVQFTDGTPVHLREKRRVEEIIDSGFIPMVRQTVLVRDMTLTPQGRTDDGDWKVEWAFDRVLGSIDSPLESATFDTKTPRTGESSLLIEPLVAIAGTSFTVTIDERGVVKSVDGAAEALKQATEPYGDEADMYRMVLRDAFSAESMRRELQFLMRAAPLPEGAVTGATDWKVEGTMAGPTGVTWTFEQQVRSTGGYNDIAEFEATGAGGASVNQGRTSAIGMLLSDEAPDGYYVDASYAIAKSDGLPLATFMSFWVDASAADEDGATSTYRHRAQYRVERVFDEELPGVQRSTRIPKIDLIEDGHPQCFIERLRWAQAKGQLYAGSEEPDAARVTYAAARELATELLDGEHDDDIAETDGGPDDWRAWWVTLTNELAAVESESESWDTAIALWESIAQHPKVVAAAEAGEGRVIWDRVHAGVMVAQTRAAKGDTVTALTRIEAAAKEIAAGREAVPDDDGLRRAHAWLLDRWSAMLYESDDPAGALAKGEESLAIQDALAATDGRTPSTIHGLVDRLWELADYALEAGDAKHAAALLDRAQNEVQALLEYQGFDDYQTALVERRDDCALIDAGGEPADAAQSLRVAYLLMSMKRNADAHPQFERALADASIREDQESHNLYNGACNAGLAHAAAADADKAPFAAAALAWLKPHVVRLQGLLASGDEDEKAGAEAYLQYIREEDGDLDTLRALPEFAALFE